MKRNYIYILGIIYLAMMTSCLEETPVFEPANPGDEVEFSLGLQNGTQTKTIYGSESDGKLSVNWVAGDQISIYGTNCLSGREKANYTITSCSGNKANVLSKDGAAGVQWGTEKSRFYAIYPSVDLSSVSGNSDQVVFKTSISGSQKVKFGSDMIGVSYDEDPSKPSMPDAIMYACTDDVIQPGKNVNLNFIPYSTVLNFTMGGWEPGQNNGNDILSIYNIRVSAKNKGISGDFNLTVSANGKASASSGSQDFIDIKPEGGEIRLVANQSFSFNVFTVPVGNANTNTVWEIDGDWSVELETSHGTYVYPLNKASGANTNLVPGYIHKITIPAIPIKGQTAAGGSTNDWITRVPTNVYISELSVPGAWYSSDPGSYQGGADNNITALYNMGIRAFHIDCRLTKMEGDSAYSLLCSGTDNQFKKVNGKYYVDGPTVLSHLQTINNLINGKNEYIVVIITIAEKGIGTVRDEPTWSDWLGADVGAQSSIKPNEVLKAINDVLSDSSLTNLYGKEDGEIVSSNTTLKDVQGKFIVKINTNTTNDIFTGEGYPVVSNALLSFASLAPDNDGDITAGNFQPTAINQMQSRMYWGKTVTDLTFYYYQAQRTYSSSQVVNDDYPTYDDRKNAISLIIRQSDDIYGAEDYRHNGWYQMGIGGYKKNITGSEDHSGLASELNTHLLGEINKKLSNNEGYTASPVGVVLMNNCAGQTGKTNSDGKETGLINAIIRMNDEFTLSRAEDDNSTPGKRAANPKLQSAEEIKIAPDEHHWVKVD